MKVYKKRNAHHLTELETIQPLKEFSVMPMFKMAESKASPANMIRVRRSTGRACAGL